MLKRSEAVREAHRNGVCIRFTIVSGPSPLQLYYSGGSNNRSVNNPVALIDIPILPADDSKMPKCRG